jgi:hypothetical protein
MNNKFGLAMCAALLAMPLAAQAQGTIRGAEQGANQGDRAAGPVGAIVGGALGAATGTVGGVLGVGERPAFREYVDGEHVRSYEYEQPVRAGVVLPETYTYYDVPERYHVQRGYRYTVVNHRPVIVEPATRRVIQVIE